MTETTRKLPSKRKRGRSRFTALDEVTGTVDTVLTKPEHNRQSLSANGASSVLLNPAVAALRAVNSSFQQNRLHEVEAAGKEKQADLSKPSPGKVVRAKKRRKGSRFSTAQPSTLEKPKRTFEAPPTVPNRTPFSSSQNVAAAAGQIDLSSIPIAPVSTLRINRTAQKKRKLDAVLKISDNDLLDKDPTRNPYYDPSIKNTISRSRPPREIKFISQGEIAAQAERKREAVLVQARRDEYRKRLADGEGELPVLPPLSKDLRVKDASIPDCEWWDQPFISKKSDASAPDKDGDFDMSSSFEIREDRITHYIHHPPPITSAVPKDPPSVLPLMLTKKESKKLRRQRRQEVQKEKQEMVALGLMPPPPPKVKLSNMRRVLLSEVTADPTKVEQQVRQQIEERKRKHELANEERKKSQEERREAAREKIASDQKAGLFAAVYRLGGVHAGQKFKISVNARQLNMSGALVLHSTFNVVVVEGGKKALRKFKKLMLRRIDWAESEKNGSAEDGNNPSNEDSLDQEERSSKGCLLLWEGQIPEACFEQFQTMSLQQEVECRGMFRKRGVEHYWNLCAQASPAGNESLGVKEIE
ncbi:U4/U6 small nuclear ribonucleoprotein Prp3 [Gracilaria domingensis]|nr:U4/U6 small nuclear ribonucleoprotein Prp3 [Gracilaria domingensis]